MSPMSDNESTGKGSSSGWSKAVIAFAAGIAVTIGAILVIERGFGVSLEGESAGTDGGFPLSLFFNILFFGIAGFLVLAVHEFGHALGGRLRGLRLAMLIVGPLHLQRETGGRLRSRLNRKLAYAGGMVSSVPRSTEGLRRAYLNFSAAGPVTSIVAGVLVLAGFVPAGPPDAGAAGGPIQEAMRLSVFVLGAMSLGIGLITLLPVHQGAFVNDGKRILTLLRPGAKADRHAAAMALGGYFLAGTRPRDWDAGVVAKTLAVADGSYDDVVGRHMAYLHALDQGEIRAAGGHIHYMMEHLAGTPAAFRAQIDVEVAYFLAAYDGNAALARARLEGAGKRALRDQATRLRVEGALLLADGDAEGAYGKFRESYASMAGSPGWGNEFVMDAMKRLCRARGLPDPGAAGVD